MNNKGETLIEMIVSIAIFSLMVGLASVAYMVANNITYGNFERRNELNLRIMAINETSASEATSKGFSLSGDIQISWVMDGDTTKTGSFRVKKLEDTEQTLSKYLLTDSTP